MMNTAMALKENGKTVAVAIRYLNKEPNNISRSVITVFSFKDKFNIESRFGVDCDFIVQDFLNSKEGRLLEALLRSKQE